MTVVKLDKELEEQPTPESRVPTPEVQKYTNPSTVRK